MAAIGQHLVIGQSLQVMDGWLVTQQRLQTILYDFLPSIILQYLPEKDSNVALKISTSILRQDSLSLSPILKTAELLRVIPLRGNSIHANNVSSSFDRKFLPIMHYQLPVQWARPFCNFWKFHDSLIHNYKQLGLIDWKKLPAADPKREEMVAIYWQMPHDAWQHGSENRAPQATGNGG